MSPREGGCVTVLLPTLAGTARAPTSFRAGLHSRETRASDAPAPAPRVHRKRPPCAPPTGSAPARKASERPSQSSRLPRASRKWLGEGGQARTGGAGRGGTSGGGGGPGLQVSGTGEPGGWGAGRWVGAPRSPCSPGGGSSRPSPAVGPPLADPRGPRSRKASATGAPPPGADLHFFRFSLFGLFPCPGLSFHPKRGPGRETLSKQACPQTRLPLGSGFPRAPRVWLLRRADLPPEPRAAPRVSAVPALPAPARYGCSQGKVAARFFS